MSEPCIYPDETAAVCLKCGLLWAHVDPQKAEKLNKKYGS